MIKQGLTSFFKNLKYCFTPLGTLFLGLLFGVCFLFSGFKIQVNQATADIKAITEQADIGFDDLKKCVIDSVAEINWNNPINAVKTITSKEWIDGTLKINLENTIDNYKQYAHDIENSVSSAIKGYVKYVVAFVCCTILGLIAGLFLTRFIIKRDISKQNALKLILTTFFDSIFTLGLTALTFYLAFLWTPNIILASIIGILIYGVISLFEAYLVYGLKKLPLKQIVNFKNLLNLSICNLLIYLISFAISGLAVAITNVFVGVFIALPLLIIAIIVISLNAETYIKQQINIY